MNVDWDHLGARPGAGLLGPDPVVPQRERFTNVEELTTQLEMPDRSAEILNVWYIPGKSLQVVYRIVPGGEVLRVRFLPAGERAPATPASGAVALTRWSAVGWWFPSDPALPELSILARPQALHGRLGPIVETRVLSYLPGERCALRVRAADGREVALKVERPPETRAAAAALQRLWTEPRRGFAMPEPLGVDAEAGLRWEAFIAGERLDADLSQAALDRLVPVVARDLVALHRIGGPDLAPLGPDRILDRIERKVLPRIDGALPALSDRARVLLRRLGAAAPALDGLAPSTLHGDLHTANVLIGGDGAVTFLDLDRLARGHVEFDLALLAGRFLLIALNRGADVAPVARAVAAFPDAYAAASGQRASEAVFAWYVAAHLLGRQLRTCIRHWVPGVAVLAPTLLDWAAATLAQGRFDPQALA